MEPLTTAALIGAGASIIGGMMSQDAADDRAAAANAQAREMATHGIRWKVEDAKAAGLHPLFALGGSGATYTPAVAQVFDQSQNLGRAAEAAATGFEAMMKENALAMSASQLEESDLRKDLLYSQIWRNYLEASPAVEMMPPAYRPGVMYSHEGSMPAGFVGLEPFTSGSPRERAAGRSGSMGQGRSVPAPELFKMKPSERIPGSPTNAGLTAGPLKPFGDQVALPFGIPVATEFGYGDRQAAVVLPQGTEVADALEALEGGHTSLPALLVYKANVATYGGEYWQALKDAWSALGTAERRMKREAAAAARSRGIRGRERDPIRDYPYPGRR